MNDFILNSTKFDGSLHYHYAVQIIQQSPDSLITFSHPGVPVESYRGKWTAKKHILSIFWLHRSYVLHFLWNDAWQPESLYVDISTGTSWDNQSVTYIDLDLDVVLHHESSEIILDDEDEFEANRLRWNYPAHLVTSCRHTVNEVRGLIEKRQPPFTPALFAWRPGLPLSF